jgi:hypothetical protein
VATKVGQRIFVRPTPAPDRKMAAPCGTAKFREETSKKADSATKGRIAAVHNVCGRSFVYKQYLALQHSRKLDSKATHW